MNESSINKHIIVTDHEWRLLINALHVFEVVITEGACLGPMTLSNLRDSFPLSTIESTERKLSPFWSNAR